MSSGLDDLEHLKDDFLADQFIHLFIVRAGCISETRLVKFIFKLLKEHGITNFSFFNHYFGPYSTEIRGFIEREIDRGFIQNIKRGRETYFKPTDACTEIIDLQLSEEENSSLRYLNSFLGTFLRKHQRWDAFWITRYIYKKYRNTTEHSVIRDSMLTDIKEEAQLIDNLKVFRKKFLKKKNKMTAKRLKSDVPVKVNFQSSLEQSIKFIKARSQISNLVLSEISDTMSVFCSLDATFEEYGYFFFNMSSHSPVDPDGFKYDTECQPVVGHLTSLLDSLHEYLDRFTAQEVNSDGNLEKFQLLDTTISDLVKFDRIDIPPRLKHNLDSVIHDLRTGEVDSAMGALMRTMEHVTRYVYCTTPDHNSRNSWYVITRELVNLGLLEEIHKAKMDNIRCIRNGDFHFDSLVNIQDAYYLWIDAIQILSYLCDEPINDLAE